MQPGTGQSFFSFHNYVISISFTFSIKNTGFFLKIKLIYYMSEGNDINKIVTLKLVQATN